MIHRFLPIVFLFVAIFTAPLSAQTATPNQIPELEKQLTAASSDTEKAKICNELSTAWAKKDAVQAIHFAEQGIGFAQKAGDAAAEILALNLKGDACLRNRDLPTAQHTYESALTKLRAFADPMLEGRTLHNVGKLHQTKGDVSLAIQFYERAYAVREQIGDKKGLGGTCMNLGVLFGEENIQKSSFYYEKALALKREANDQPGIATVLSSLAGFNIRLSHFTEARQQLEEAIDIHRTLGNTTSLQACYDKMAQALWNLGETARAETFFTQAIELAKKGNDDLALASIYNNYGQFLIEQNDFLKATAQFQAGLPLAESLVPENEALVFDISMGLAHIKGLQHFLAEELAIYAKIEKFTLSDARRANLLGSKSAALCELSRFQEALVTSQKGLALARKAKSTSMEINNLHYLTIAFLGLKKYDEALETVDKGIDIARKTENKIELGSLLALKSSIQTKSSDENQAALANARAALLQANKFGNKLETARIHEQLAEVYRRMGKADQAVAELKMADVLHDSVYDLGKVRDQTILEQNYGFDKERKLKQAEMNLRNAETAAQIDIQKSLRHMYLLGFLVLLILLGCGFYVWKTRQKNKARQLQENIRQRIARDLHDDLGSTLSSISILSQSTPNSLQDLDQTRFGNIGDKARAALDSMSDIVWAVNPDNDSMEKLLARMSAYASEMLENVGTELRFQVGTGVESLTLPMGKRKDFYLIFKEAIHNCVKYARAKRVEIALEKQGNLLIMNIKDDGVGFETKNMVPEVRNLGGNGLRNMRSRAAALGGTLEVMSAPGAGTEIRLAIPL